MQIYLKVIQYSHLHNNENNFQSVFCISFINALMGIIIRILFLINTIDIE